MNTDVHVDQESYAFDDLDLCLEKSTLEKVELGIFLCVLNQVESPKRVTYLCLQCRMCVFFVLRVITVISTYIWNIIQATIIHYSTSLVSLHPQSFAPFNSPSNV